MKAKEWTPCRWSDAASGDGGITVHLRDIPDTGEYVFNDSYLGITRYNAPDGIDYFWFCGTLERDTSPENLAILRAAWIKKVDAYVEKHNAPSPEETKQNRELHKPIRWTVEEWQRVKTAAQRQGLSPSSFVRSTALAAARKLK